MRVIRTLSFIGAVVAGAGCATTPPGGPIARLPEAAPAVITTLPDAERIKRESAISAQVLRDQETADRVATEEARLRARRDLYLRPDPFYPYGYGSYGWGQPWGWRSGIGVGIGGRW
ncbi:hypothetical protein [Derxia gummosa]|uniref:Lipoprotein n=1 Tax=Derxia gummosa DSM 723 TaxID=1121388 RepID=A0A8B6X7N8_9BURK|nr:hypothetical protein [Derxia gummosa]